MNDIESKYKGKILSKTDSVVDLTSKSSLQIDSKKEWSLLSDARKADGAADIVAMAGVFSKCRRQETGDARMDYLIRKHL